MEYLNKPVVDADTARRLLSPVLPALQLTVPADAALSVSVTTGDEPFVAATRITSDRPFSMVYEPAELVSFGRVSATDARVTYRGYSLDDQKPFALIDGTFRFTSEQRVALEFISVARSDVERVATSLSPEESFRPEWVSATPVRPDAVRFWQRTFAYGRDVLLWPDTNELDVAADVTALLLRAAARTFVASAPVRPHTRPAVSAAIDIMTARAGEKITLPEMARAAGVSERVLQYGFVEDLGCTPVEFLRRIRLARARDDLRATHSSDQSISAIAAQWQFSNVGRFARAYADEFGEHPRDTPRNNDSHSELPFRQPPAI